MYQPRAAAEIAASSSGRRLCGFQTAPSGYLQRSPRRLRSLCLEGTGVQKASRRLALRLRQTGLLPSFHLSAALLLVERVPLRARVTWPAE